MTVYVFKIVDEAEEVYWVDDPSDITDMFGIVLEVTRYHLVDPVDVTDEANRGHLKKDDYT